MTAVNLTALLTALQQNAAIWIPLFLVVLSSIATGLSNYPKASGAVTVLRKIMGWLSFAQHYDSPGSLKLPIVQPPEPPAVIGVWLGGGSVVPPKGMARLEALAVSVMLCVMGAVAFVPACKTASIIPDQILSCAEQSLPSAAVGLVSSALSSQSVNWASALESLGVQYGLPVVECIVATLIGDYKPDAGAADAALPAPIVLVRGQAWLQAHGVSKIR
jgi:hypothetical protein